MAGSKVLALNDFVDYVTNPDHVWDPEKYISNRNCSGITDTGVEYNFKYSYTVGNAYMVGLFGKDAAKVEVYYRDLNGFQITVIRAIGGQHARWDWPGYRIADVKKFLGDIASH